MPPMWGLSSCPGSESRQDPAAPGRREPTGWQDAASPWHTAHKGALLMAAALQGSGTLLQLVNLDRHGGQVGGGNRGEVGDTPSPGVHRRFCQAMAGIAWESLKKQDLWVLVLTYHGVLKSGLQARADKKAFMRRLDRILGPRGQGCWSGVWVKEFQARGSIHYHMVLHTPYGAPPGFYDIVRDAWLSVIHEDDDMAAWLHGVECSQVADVHKVKAYVSKYMGKSERYAAKAYQKRQPAWFKNGGRWWGVVGRSLARCYEVMLLHTLKEFVSVKRLLRSYIRSVTHGHYTPKSYGAMNGMTVLGHGNDYGALRDLMRWVFLQRPIVALAAT